MAGDRLTAFLPVDALAYGLGIGLVSRQLAASAADIFAGPRFGAIYGMFNLASGLGSAVVPWLVGRLIEVTGPYELGFVAAASTALGSGLLIWVAAPRARVNASRRHDSLLRRDEAFPTMRPMADG